jgi:hypothetical protein
MGVIHPGVVEILDFDSFRPLQSCWGMMHISHVYTLRITGRMLVLGSYRSQHVGANIKPFLIND